MHKSYHRNSNLIHSFYFNLKVFIQNPTPFYGNSIITYTYKRQEQKRTKVTKRLSPSQPSGIFCLHILKAALWYIHFFNDPKKLHWKLTDCQNAEALLHPFLSKKIPNSGQKLQWHTKFHWPAAERIPKQLANTTQGQAKGMSSPGLHLQEQLEMEYRLANFCSSRTRDAGRQYS